MRSQDESADATFIDLARAHLRTGQTLGPSNRSTNYAPRVLHLLAETEGRTVSVSTLEEAMQRLLQRGWLSVEETTRGQRLHVTEDGFDAEA